MQKVRTTVVTLLFAAAVAAVHAQAPKAKAAPAAPAKAAAAAPKHTMTTAAELKWGPGSDALPPGAQFAVVDGDPGKAGAPFVIRAKLPNGYRVPPHFHPSDESVTVLSGNLAFGMGDKTDDASMKQLGPGGFARMPKGMRHYVLAKSDTEIQVHAIGRSPSPTSTRRTIPERRRRLHRRRSDD